MRAARYHGREDIRIEEVEEPAPGPGEVKLRVLYNGLCGSDVHEFFDGPIATSTTPHRLTGCALPCILGHELSGEVVERGAGVEGVAIGDTVAVEPIETCGVCPRCMSGSRHLCRLIAFHGYTRPGGGLSDFTVVRRDMVHVLPTGLSGLHGALVEPMAVSHRAVRRVGASAGDLVAVHGAGPIGLGAVLALRAGGLRSVVADPSPTRRLAAARLGADHVLDPTTDDVAAAVRDLTGGLGAAGAIDAAGAPSAVQSALRSTHPDGTIVLVGHHAQPIALRSGSLIFVEVKVTGSHIYDQTDIDAVIGAMADGRYPLEGWTSTIELEDVVGEGLVPLREQGTNKVLVRLGGPG